MKLPIRLTLVLANFSLIFAAVAAFMFYFDWYTRPTTTLMASSHGIAAVIAESKDIDSVKAVCQKLALSHDESMASTESMSLLVTQLFNSTLGFVLGWGLISGAAFLYLHFLLRRISREAGPLSDRGHR
jgi:hypothetical protein